MDSLFGWIGGKRLLRKHIARIIPTDIDSYVEPFGGAAWVLLYRDRWAQTEVYNDLDSRLVNLFRNVKAHPGELVRQLELMPASREMFDQFVNQPGLTELEQAARFLFLLTRSFGAKGESFGRSKSTPPTSMMNKLGRVWALSERLDHVYIENLHYQKLIELYDHPGAFFYCDPPYVHGASYETAKEFSHEELRDVLRGVKGRWLLSYDDCPEVLNLYRGYEIVHVSRAKGINPKAGKRMFAEVLIANYNISEKAK